MRYLVVVFTFLFSVTFYGQNDYSMSFDGEDDYVDLQSAGLSNTPSELTETAWIKYTGNSALWGIVLTKRNSISQSWATLGTQGGNIFFSRDAWNCGNQVTGSSVDDNLLHHIAGVMDGNIYQPRL